MVQRSLLVGCFLPALFRPISYSCRLFTGISMWYCSCSYCLAPKIEPNQPHAASFYYSLPKSAISLRIITPPSPLSSYHSRSLRVFARWPKILRYPPSHVKNGWRGDTPQLTFSPHSVSFYLTALYSPKEFQGCIQCVYAMFGGI